MSYILDALKKSERDRPPGPVPDLFTVHGPQPPAPRRPARAIVVGALLVILPAIALWAWIGTGRRDENVTRPPADSSPPLHAEAPALPATPRTVAVPTPPAVARVAAAVVDVEADAASAQAPARTPVDKRPLSSAPPTQISRGAVASAVVPVAIPAAPPVIPAPLSPAEPVPASVTAVPIPIPPAPIMSAPAVIPPPPQPGMKAPSIPMPMSEMPPSVIQAAPPATSLETVPAAPASEETPPADGRVLDLAELPTTIRAGLPKLLVSGHVWSEEPTLRLLSVDDRLLREGGEVAPGVSLQEITPAGAVFVYKGWRFRVGGGRP